MNVLLVIPVRMGSSRFPGKPLALINGKSMVRTVHENASESELVSRIVVATCDEEIRREVLEFGGEAVMTSSSHTRATERTYEALKILDPDGTEFDLVVMLQGDEPCITGAMIDQQLEVVNQNPNFEVTNLVGRITSREDHEDPNTIKAVIGEDRRILYFSRVPIPGVGSSGSAAVGKQVCSITFSPKALEAFVSLDESELERSESIDMLRLLENGRTVHGVATESRTHAVDVRSDIPVVERIISGINEPGL